MKMCSFKEDIHFLIAILFLKSMMEFPVRARDTELDDQDHWSLRMNERGMLWDNTFLPESSLGFGRMAKEGNPPTSSCTRLLGAHVSSKHAKEK